MFEVQIDNIKVGVKFGYGKFASVGKQYTQCVVKDTERLENKWYFGVAECSHEDNFNKNTGRKIALARAIKPASRPVRKVIWNAYFKARGRVD